MTCPSASSVGQFVIVAANKVGHTILGHGFKSDNIQKVILFVISLHYVYRLFGPLSLPMNTKMAVNQKHLQFERFNVHKKNVLQDQF